jgi:hypothetical protein
MNIKAIILCACIAALPAMAGKIVTYTATSKISQEEANNSAIAGVAKQVKSKISATQKQTKFEDIYNGESTLGETYRANNTVKSNVVLKGVKVVPVKADKGFKATATLDMDEFTADLRFRLNTLKQEIADLEKTSRQAFSDRIYINSINDLDAAKEKVNEYNFYLAQLADVYPIDDSYRLQHGLADFEKILVERLSRLTFETTAKADFEIGRPEMPSWDVIVKDSLGPVPSFPLIARQSKTLAERRTQDDGTVTFSLRNVNFEKGPYVIIVEPNFPYELLKKTGMMNALEVPYRVIRSRCEVSVQCNLPSNICKAIDNALSKKSIYTTNDDTVSPPLKVEVSSDIRNKLGALKSYDVSISIKGAGVDFFSMSKGAGKNETDATLSAIKKTDFSPLQKQLEPYCGK